MRIRQSVQALISRQDNKNSDSNGNNNVGNIDEADYSIGQKQRDKSSASYDCDNKNVMEAFPNNSGSKGSKDTSNAYTTNCNNATAIKASYNGNIIANIKSEIIEDDESGDSKFLPVNSRMPSLRVVPSVSRGGEDRFSALHEAEFMLCSTVEREGSDENGVCNNDDSHHYKTSNSSNHSNVHVENGNIAASSSIKTSNIRTAKNMVPDPFTVAIAKDMLQLQHRGTPSNGTNHSSNNDNMDTMVKSFNFLSKTGEKTYEGPPVATYYHSSYTGGSFTPTNESEEPVVFTVHHHKGNIISSISSNGSTKSSSNSSSTNNSSSNVVPGKFTTSQQSSTVYKNSNNNNNSNHLNVPSSLGFSSDIDSAANASTSTNGNSMEHKYNITTMDKTLKISSIEGGGVSLATFPSALPLSQAPLSSSMATITAHMGNHDSNNIVAIDDRNSRQQLQQRQQFLLQNIRPQHHLFPLERPPIFNENINDPTEPIVVMADIEAESATLEDIEINGNDDLVPERFYGQFRIIDSPSTLDHAPENALGYLRFQNDMLYITEMCTVIGRNSSSSQVHFHVADNNLVSRKHFQILYNASIKQFFVNCLSKNGIFVDKYLQRKDVEPLRLPPR